MPCCGSRGACCPRLRAEHPDLRFVVVGRRPGRRLRRCAMRLGFTLTGAVPDVRPFLAHAAVAVAPLRVARGVPNKVLEAMAMAKAVVATPAAARGLRVRAGQDIVLASRSRCLRPGDQPGSRSAVCQGHGCPRPRPRARRLCLGAQPAPAGPSGGARSDQAAGGTAISRRLTGASATRRSESPRPSNFRCTRQSGRWNPASGNDS